MKITENKKGRCTGCCAAALSAGLDRTYDFLLVAPVFLHPAEKDAKNHLTNCYGGGYYIGKAGSTKKGSEHAEKIVRLILMSNISRRKFLKGAGVAALAVAAAGVLAGCSGNDVPAVPGVTTRPVTVIFMKDEGDGKTNVVGETAKIDVLKTENSVKVADIDKKLLPEDYHLENENAVVEIRKDDSKGEYIIVFVTDVTVTPTKKTIDVKLLELPNNIIKAKAEVAVDATGVSAADIQLPDGYKLSADYGTEEELLKVRPFDTMFIVTKI